MSIDGLPSVPSSAHVAGPSESQGQKNVDFSLNNYTLPSGTIVNIKVIQDPTNPQHLDVTVSKTSKDGPEEALVAIRDHFPDCTSVTLHEGDKIFEYGNEGGQSVQHLDWELPPSHTQNNADVSITNCTLPSGVIVDIKIKQDANNPAHLDVKVVTVSKTDKADSKEVLAAIHDQFPTCTSVTLHEGKKVVEWQKSSSLTNSPAEGKWWQPATW